MEQCRGESRNNSDRIRNNILREEVGEEPHIELIKRKRL